MYACKKSSLLITSLSFLLSAAAFAETKLTIQPFENLPPLDTRHGYLLFNLNAQSKHAKIQLSRFKLERGLTYLDVTQKVRKYSENIIIDLQGKKQGFYGVELEEGLYHIEQIDAPMFNLPFQLELRNIPGWRVSIKANHTNYAGLLAIEEERTIDSIYVSLKPRFATDQQTLVDAYPQQLTQYPLRSAEGAKSGFMMLMQHIDSAASGPQTQATPNTQGRL